MFRVRMWKMKSVVIRNVRIGEGIPKICVPVTGTKREEILREAETVRHSPADIAEWRADWYEDVFEGVRVEELLKEIREILGDMPLLFTFRTLKEGGKREAGLKKYMELNRIALLSGCVDLIDVELFAGDEAVTEMIGEAHRQNVRVIVSNHDFEKTPGKEELIRRLCKMQELKGDICKLAVMPENKKDVLTLLEATEEMVREHAERPVITMSMAADGVLSRLCGELTGSAVTFGQTGRASAPGQIEAGKLRAVLDILHEGMNSL